MSPLTITRSKYSDEESSSDEDSADQNRPQPKLLGYAKLTKRENYALTKCPILPLGWSGRTDEQNRAFFIDDHACQGHKRCFWLPPIPEKYPKKPVPAGWVRVKTSFGRLFWRHKSGLLSYEHPHKALNIRYSPEEYHFRIRVKGRYDYQLWYRVDEKRLILDDVEIACQMTRKAWEQGWQQWWNEMAKPERAEDGTYRYSYR